MLHCWYLREWQQWSNAKLIKLNDSHPQPFMLGCKCFLPVIMSIEHNELILTMTVNYRWHRNATAFAIFGRFLFHWLIKQLCIVPRQFLSIHIYSYVVCCWHLCRFPWEFHQVFYILVISLSLLLCNQYSSQGTSVLFCMFS